MEADLARYYRVDFRDLWRPTPALTFRRLRVLLNGLPPESLWWTALRAQAPADVTPAGDIDQIRWGTIHDLLAALIDATHEVAWVTRAANSSKKVPPPAPFPRPGTRRSRRAGMSARARARIDQLVNSQRRRDGV